MTANAAGVIQQDRTLSDLLEEYRYLKADSDVPDARKIRASERMESVWAKLAKLQDPNGFINYLSGYIQREYQRRHHHEDDPDITRREKPLCRCDRSRHVCEPKQGKVPSKIQTQDLNYIQTDDEQKMARDYVHTHTGDVVVREAMESYQNLRGDCYAEITSINTMMREDEAGAPATTDSGASGAANANRGETPAELIESSDAPSIPEDTDAAVDELLAEFLEDADTEELAADAACGVTSLAKVMEGFQNEDVDVSDLQSIVDGDSTTKEVETELETDESSTDTSSLTQIDTDALGGGEE